MKEVIKNSGAIFCHVVSIKQDIQGSPAITLGSQK
jgi:hypothetical protein